MSISEEMSPKVEVCLTELEKNERVISLRKLLEDDANLKNLQSSDHYLLRFLYSTKFDIQAAYNKMKMFYETMLESPEWFTKEGPLDKKSLIDQGIRVMIPEKDKDGRPIYIAFLGNMNVKTMSLYDMIAVDDIWAESIDDYSSIQNGLCVILDLANIQWQIIKWLRPNNIRTAVKIMESYPLSEFRIHIVNSAFMIDKLINLVWPFLSSNLKKMVKFHFNNRESLYEHIDQHVLPSKYGGKKPDEYNECYEKLFELNKKIVDSFKMNRTIDLNH